MKPDQLLELSRLATQAADWLDDPKRQERDVKPKWFKDRTFVLYDCILGGKYGIVLTTTKMPEAWK